MFCMTDEYDRQKGAALIKEGAEAESKAAQYTLANLYADGEGVAQSDEQVLYWFHKAAEKIMHWPWTSLPGLA